MAKSQYTDSITGDVLIDIRAIDNKIMNLSDYAKYSTPYSRSSFSLSSNHTSFNDKSILVSNNFYGIWSKSNTIINNFTISWWVYIQNPVQNAQTSAQIRFTNKAAVYGVPMGTRTDYSYIEQFDGTNFITKTSNEQNTNKYATKNAWHHIAFVRESSNYRLFIDGSLACYGTNSYFYPFSWLYVQYYTGSGGSMTLYIDDLVFINNQCLWPGTGSFTVPNYFLTGDHPSPKKLLSRNIIYPTPKSLGDYYDKAFIY